MKQNEPKNLFGNVVLKNKSGQTYRVKEYADIKPDKKSSLHIFRRMGNVSPQTRPTQKTTRSYRLI
jgi:hypothetical protein